MQFCRDKNKQLVLFNKFMKIIQGEILESSLNVHYENNPDKDFWRRRNLSNKEIRRNLNSWGEERHKKEDQEERATGQ